MNDRTPEDVFAAQLEVEREVTHALQIRRSYRIAEQAYHAAEVLTARQGSDGLFADDDVWQELLPAEADAAPFLTELLDKLASKGVTTERMLSFFIAENADGSARVAYVKNRYTERAFSSFRMKLCGPTVSYHETFAESCAAVRSGEADLCILPWRDAFRTPLYTFFRLAEEYDLVLRALCRLPDGEDGDVWYALCGKELTVPSEHVWIDFFLPSRGGTVFEQMVAFSSALGATPTFAEAKLDRYTEHTVWRVTLDVPTKRSLCALLLYFRLYGTDAEVLGVYAPPMIGTHDM